jgi:hypothetical protein
VNRLRRCLLHRVAASVLALFMALHGLAAGFAAARGPAHVHRAPRDAAWGLEDLRRSVPTASRHPVHVATPFGHVHAGPAVAHHHHAHDDASVVPVADAAATLAADDVAGAALNAWVAILAAPGAWWVPPAQIRDAPMHAAWTPSSHAGAPPERPPRTA